MMKTYFNPLFLFFCLFLLHPVQAQWQQIALTKGLPTNNFVHHQGSYFINYQTHVFRSTDGVHWQNIASPIVNPSPTNYLQLVSDGTRLYAVLRYNNSGLYVSEDNGDTWTLVNTLLNVPSGKIVATADALYAYTPALALYPNLSITALRGRPFFPNPL
ncbi:MAG: exo-alpha-sialidase [Lewinellaceae bacterium]|nr:exo-alpha-sialidase [Lewinellaceae bacterium]